MIFPIGDDNVQGGARPYFSYGLIAVNVAIFVLQVMTPGQLVCDFATIPADILKGENTYTLISSMFLHGGIMHLLGNMLYLWIFGDNIEATIGNVKFIVIYILGGIFASAGHIFLGAGGTAAIDCCSICGIDPCDLSTTNIVPCVGSIPSLGASGAISTLMGAYLVMFPKSRIKMLFFIKTFYIPAFLFLLYWIGQQIFSGMGTIGGSGASGVAWWAHIGGFVFGLAVGFVFRGQVKLIRE